MKATTMAWGAVLVAVAGALAVGCNSTVDETQNKGLAPIVGGVCEEEGAVASCGAKDAGEVTCEKTKSGLVWSSCIVEDKPVDQCSEGQTLACTIKVQDGPNNGTIDMPGVQNCEVGADGKLGWGQCQGTSASTPLVFSFDGSHATFSNPGGVFGLNPTMSVATDWPSAATPWLALDRNHDGSIGDGGELFGSATQLEQGSFAKNGFQALAELDANHDGRIDRADPAFNSLVVWADANQNRVSEPNELVTLSSMGIESIDLAFSNATHCDQRGNCEVETSSFEYREPNGTLRSGRIVDVHLEHH